MISDSLKLVIKMDRDRRHTHSVTLPGELPSYTPQETAYLESNIGVTSPNINNNVIKPIPPPPPAPMFPVGYIQPQHLISLQGSHSQSSQSLPKYIQDGAAMSMPEIQQMNLIHGGNYTTPRRLPRTKQERYVEVGRMPAGHGHSLAGMTQVPAATWATGKYSSRQTQRLQEAVPSKSLYLQPYLDTSLGSKIAWDKINSGRHFKERDTDLGMCNSWRKCWMSSLCFIAQILLHGLLGVLLYWILKYRSNDSLIPFVWVGSMSDNQLFLENLHSLLTICGTIYCTGQAILVYIFYNCCSPGCSRFLHLMFHLLSVPCVVIGSMAAWDMDSITSSHLVTMHAWCGAATIFLLAVQMVFGLVSFAVLQCYKTENEKYKAKILPLHWSLGITIFLLSITSAITGITQTERRSDGNSVVASNSTSMFQAILFDGLQEEGLVLNVLGLIMIFLAVIIPAVIACNQKK